MGSHCRLSGLRASECAPRGSSGPGRTDCYTDYYRFNFCCMPMQRLRRGEEYARWPGILAAEWTPEHITVFWFPRAEIPADLASGSPRPDGWSRFVVAFMPFERPCAGLGPRGADVQHQALRGRRRQRLAPERLRAAHGRGPTPRASALQDSSSLHTSARSTSRARPRSPASGARPTSTLTTSRSSRPPGPAAGPRAPSGGTGSSSTDATQARAGASPQPSCPRFSRRPGARHALHGAKVPWASRPGSRSSGCSLPRRWALGPR
mmetsp:Transcript_108835/g.351362  ORF Transcript_108835/g.351362 Transcript_108835/m.351362 type:complete len:264 (+) Transcript_108835:828-1619(+)